MFTGAHLHLLVNHAPIFGSLFALAVLSAYSLWAGWCVGEGSRYRQVPRWSRCWRRRSLGGVMVYTGLLGGQVRHTEVRPGATAADAMKIEPPRQRRPPLAGAVHLPSSGLLCGSY
jgi:hypothetical protein